MEFDPLLYGKFSDGWHLRSTHGLLGGMMPTPK